MSSAEEMVWVVPAKDLEVICVPLGTQFTPRRDLLDAFWTALENAFFKERDQVEDDPTLKQIIPYIVVSSGGKFLSYRRAGSEGRLTDKISIGIGGHINPDDQKSVEEPALVTVLRGVDREIMEELYLKDLMDRKFPPNRHFSGKLLARGLLHDCSDPVGRVHYGVVFRADLPWETARFLMLSSENKNLEWRGLDELVENTSLETWSRIVVDALADEGVPLQ